MNVVLKDFKWHVVKTLLVFYATMVVGNYATCRDIRLDREPIYDLLHQVDFTITQKFTDYMLTVINVLTVGLGIYFYKTGLKEKCFNLINNINILYGCRVLTILFTAFPNSRRCTVEPSCDSILYNVRADFCGDIMYSGHTVSSLLFTLYFTSIIKYNYLKYILYVLQICYCFCIIFTRIHYTDDVLVGVMVSIMSFKLINK